MAKKRFVVALDSGTSDQDEKFREYAKKHGYGWWRWINNFWLLTANDDLSAPKLRTDLGDIYPGVTKLVIELKEKKDTWAGYGPNSDDRDMFKWLQENWSG